MTVADHGHANKLVAGLFIVLIIMIYLFVKLIIFLCVKSRVLRYMFLTFVFVVSIWYCFRVHNSCEDWELGIGHSKILNGIGEAKIENPKYCELSIRHGLYDPHFRHGTCEQRAVSFHYDFLPDHLIDKKDEIKTIGYPRIEHLNYELIDTSKTNVIIQHIKRNLIDMDDPNVPQETKDNIEFTLNLENPDAHELKIQVKRNQTRVDELKLLREKLIEQRKEESKPPIPDYNVLIFYIDNLSRAHFHRALPKLSAWLSEFTPEKEADLQAVEYFRYHTIGRITSECLNAVFYGQSEINIKGDAQYVSRFYSDNGFITGIQRDECEYEAEQVSKDESSDQEMYAYDHYGSTIF
jgi:hypothetical protein